MLTACIMVNFIIAMGEKWCFSVFFIEIQAKLYYCIIKLFMRVQWYTYLLINTQRDWLGQVVCVCLCSDRVY